MYVGKMNLLQFILRIGIIFLTIFLSTLLAKPIRIMPVGDSITHGISYIPVYPYKNNSIYLNVPKIISQPNRIAYRGKLWDLLKSENYDIDFVGSMRSGSNYPSTVGNFDTNHEGHGGRSSAYFRANIGSFMQISQPNIVLLQIGTNDPANFIPIGTYDNPNQSENTSVNNIRHILNTIFTKNPQAKVFVSRIIKAKRAENWRIPLGNNNAFWTTNEFNNKIEEMINNHPQSPNIRIVDMQNGAGFIYEPAGTSLGDMQSNHVEEKNAPDFHPNVNGYAKMAHKWFNEMVASGWLQNEDNPDPIVEPDQGNGNNNIELDVSKWSGVGMSHNNYIGTVSYQGISYINCNPLSNNGGMYQAIKTEIGKSYTLTATLIGANHYTDLDNFTLGKSYISIEDTVPTPTSTPNYTSSYISGSVPQTVELTFIATSTTTYISLRGDTAYKYPNLSRISVK